MQYVCRVFRWLGKPSPPTKNLVGRYVEGATETHFLVSTCHNGQVLPLACPLCDTIRGMLPPNIKTARVQISLGQLVDMITRGPDAEDRAQLPYDILDIEVQYPGSQFRPMFDIRLGLLNPYSGRTI